MSIVNITNTYGKCSMFEGTSLVFKIGYFITAMLPAYLLLVLQFEFCSNRWSNYVVAIVLTLVALIIGCCIKKQLKRRRMQGVSSEIQNFRVQSKNGDSMTFLFGVIIPSIVLPDTAGNIEKLIITIVIQIICFRLLLNSTEILPNVVLNFLKIDIYMSKDGIYIITVNERIKIDEVEVALVRLGDSRQCNIFLLGEKEE